MRHVIRELLVDQVLTAVVYNPDEVAVVRAHSTCWPSAWPETARSGSGGRAAGGPVIGSPRGAIPVALFLAAPLWP
jgi:hypothetical protein